MRSAVTKPRSYCMYAHCRHMSDFCAYTYMYSRDDFEGSPAQLAMHLSVQSGSQAGRYVNSLQTEEIGSLRERNMETLRCKILESTSTRMTTYREFNQNVARHRMYEANVPENERIAFTRIRLGSHRLKIETGRWSRIPETERLCTCGSVQTEKHVLLDCPESNSLREHFPRLNFSGLTVLMDAHPLDLARLCKNILEKYDS